MREILDSFTDPDIERVVFKKAAQVSGTEGLLNAIAYTIAEDPGPTLLVEPTLEMAEAVSKDRITTLLRDCPILKGKVADARSRDSKNRILHKVFPGGHLTLAGANSPASLRSRAVRFLLLDEISGYAASAGKEGDPIDLARVRSETYWNRKEFDVSTPTIEGNRLDRLYEETDQRNFFVPCPHCGEFQVLRFENLRYEGENPSAVKYVCGGKSDDGKAFGCGALIDHRHKKEMLHRGEWRATAKAKKPGYRGYWINKLYSPWVTWASIVEHYLEAKKAPDTWKVFVNTVLAESYKDEQGEIVDDGTLYGRREVYPAEAPKGVLVVTAAADVQADRLELEAVGWGRGETSWGLEKRVFFGNPAEKQVWKDLDDYLLTREFGHETGVGLKIAAAFVDSGYRQKDVFAFTKPRIGRRIFACKGFAGQGKPILAHPKKQDRMKVRVYHVGVDAVKEFVYSRLRLTEPDKPGYCHYHRGKDAGGAEVYDKEHFKQLTAERCNVHYRGGYPVRRWEIAEGRRNEALDLRVYAYGALVSLHPNLSRLFDKLEREITARAGELEQSKAAAEAVAKPETVDPEKTQAPAADEPRPKKKHRKHRAGYLGIGGGRWL